MDRCELAPLSLDISDHRIGEPQRSGAMTVLPLFGPDFHGRFAAPLSGLKLAGVEGYGKVTMRNPADKKGGVAIVPLHIGYIQDQAQNHALCRSAFIAAGQTLRFTDACCVQQSQGGYLEGGDQWFFVLPVQLREDALAQRGREGYGKLWEAISQLNVQLGLPSRGHLEQVICRQRPYLTQYVSRFELLTGQTGALFFLRGKLVGVEVTPSAKYFEELWMPLVCFCYGVGAMDQEGRNGGQSLDSNEPFVAGNIEELRQQLIESRAAVRQRLIDNMRNLPPERFKTEEEDRFLELQLSTVTGRNFAGQVVRDDERLVYASLFARRRYLNSKDN